MQRGVSLDEMVIISFDNVVQFIIITMNVRFLMACPFSKEQKLEACFKARKILGHRHVKEENLHLRGRL